MTPLRVVFYYLWFAPRLLQVIILIVLIRRHFVRRFPIFTAFTALSIFKFIALFVISRSFDYPTYFLSYSATLGISIALFFGIICDIFADVFGNHAALRKIKKPLFRWITVALLTVAFSLPVYTHRFDIDPTWFTVHVIERSANILLCGLILTLFLISFYLGISLSRPLFGIALGVGILCCVGLALAALRSQIGQSSHRSFDLIDMATYHISVLIWLFYLIAPYRARTQTDVYLPPNDLESWNAELEQLSHQ